MRVATPGGPCVWRHQVAQLIFFAIGGCAWPAPGPGTYATHRRPLDPPRPTGRERAGSGPGAGRGSCRERAAGAARPRIPSEEPPQLGPGGA